MMVLTVMILMAANIFQSSSAAWNIGTQKASMNTAARAALDYMARELVCAVAGEVQSAALATPASISFALTDGKDVTFVALSGDPDKVLNRRALRGMRFYYDPASYTLKHERCTESFDPYAGPPGVGSVQVMIENVLSLTMRAYADESALNGTGTDTWPAGSLPLCLDIAIEMLSEDDMARKDAGASGDFENRNAKVYSTRVYFPNRVGYQAR